MGCPVSDNVIMRFYSLQQNEQMIIRKAAHGRSLAQALSICRLYFPGVDNKQLFHMLKLLRTNINRKSTNQHRS